jgi:glyoxylase-like metal-dependent hydrolase (beta-lactamase superfamily II)
LKIEARLTWGHSRGGTSCYITGLARPVVVVGDALFASSMGGGMISYSDALKTNLDQLFTLPDDTIVCPGHGPLTSIGEEKAHNPFYPSFK